LLVDGQPVAYGRLFDGTYFLAEHAYEWAEDLERLGRNLVQYQARTQRRQPRSPRGGRRAHRSAKGSAHTDALDEDSMQALGYTVFASCASLREYVGRLHEGRRVGREMAFGGPVAQSRIFPCTALLTCTFIPLKCTALSRS
jgi:hypothetical protein